MFNYNPGNQNVSGQLMAQGIQQGLARIGKGLQEHRQKQAEKQAEEAAVQFAVQKGWVQDEAEAKAAVKALGGGRAAVPFIAQMQQMEQQQLAQEQQARAAAAARAQEEAAVKAAMAATAGQPNPGLAVQAYMQAGGRDPQTAGMLGKLPEPAEAPATLQFTEDPISGSRFAVGGKGNFASSGVNPAKKQADDPPVQQVKIGEKTYFIGPGNRYFDETGQQVNFTGQGDSLAAALRGLTGDDAAPDATPADPDAPVTITTQEEFDKLPAGATFIYNGRQGTKR